MGSPSLRVIAWLEQGLLVGGYGLSRPGGNLGFRASHANGVCASWYGAPHHKVVGGRHIMMQDVGVEEAKRFCINALFFIPPKWPYGQHTHPTYTLLGFSAALAP